MMKCIKYLLGVVLFSLSAVAMDDAPEISISVTGKSAHFTYRSIKDDDDSIIDGIARHCGFKEGFPDNPLTWAQNLIIRQKGGNSYSALILEESGAPVGVLGLGRMPVLNYDSNFIDIIDTYVEFGVTCFKNPDSEGKYAKDNIERVGNWGLGTLLPIMPESLGEEKIREALKVGIEVFKFLKNSTRLPLEGTTPAHIIGLFHPEDPLIPHLRAVGFEILSKEGFFSYYGKPRVMARLSLK